MKNSHPPLRTVNMVRYVTPLREGGSMPAIVEGHSVLKFLKSYSQTLMKVLAGLNLMKKYKIYLKVV
jgi:hypothetical protein